MDWIFSCDLDDFDIHKALDIHTFLDWEIDNHPVKTGDHVYVYVGEPENAIRYKCMVGGIYNELIKKDIFGYFRSTGNEHVTLADLDFLLRYKEPGVDLQKMRSLGFMETIKSAGIYRMPAPLKAYLNSLEKGDIEEPEYEDIDADEDDSDESPLEDLKGYEREAVVKARVNQSKFRKKLIMRYGKCCLCGVNMPDLLVASHIKPWVISDKSEKVDINNGLLLCPNHDRLFDGGYISFDENGKIMISDELDKISRLFMNVSETQTIDIPNEMQDYLKYHRDNVFKR